MASVRNLPPMAGGAPTIEELEARQRDIRQSIQEIDDQHSGSALPEEIREEWNALNSEFDSNAEVIRELRARRERVLALAGESGASTEIERFSAPAPGATRGADIWDLSTLRSLPSEEAVTRELRGRISRAVDLAHFPDTIERSAAQAHVMRLFERFAGDDGGQGVGNDDGNAFARRVLTTGSPAYKRAFSKTIAGRPLSPDEQRALALGGTVQYAVPYTMDPTVIPTSNWSVNPFRAISRVETIMGNTWNGVTSAGVTAAYEAESAEVADGTPTLVQPTLTVEKAHAFVPFTIEAGDDWGGLQTEMARMFADAKDDLEAEKFTTGSGTNEPFGLLTGATTTVTSATGGAFVIADLYGTEAALPARFRPRAQWVANRAIYQKIRQFDTAGGAGLWVQLGSGLEGAAPTSGNIGAQLLGFPANEDSAMGTSIAKDALYLVIGDFRYFVIVDRVGMSVEVVPHLFATGNNRPSGQRGLYAYWRNNSKVLSANAFRVLKGGA